MGYKEDRKKRGQQNREWGHEAERIATEYFIKEGYTIREQNLKIGNHLEIDLVVEKDRTMVFVEVKARREGGQDPVAAVDFRKRNRIIKGADTYLRQLEHLYQYRFDIVTLIGTAEKYEMTHYPDAYLPPVNGARRR